MTHNNKIKKVVYKKSVYFVFDNKDRSIARLENNLPNIIEKMCKFYKIKNPNFIIEFVYTRKELNQKLGYKTPKWQVAAVMLNNIFMFSPSVIENFSTHNKKEVNKLLIHEICHIFNNSINKNCLMWIDEGMSLFLAKQKKDKCFDEKDLNYFVKNCLNKNTNLRPFAEHNGYKISYWIINTMIEYFGKEEILILLRIKPTI